MSWLSRGIAASFRSQEGHHGDDASDDVDDQRASAAHGHGKGVKDDLSELTKTFTRQLWGVASFLAPPPQTNPKQSDQSESARPLPDDPPLHLQIDPLNTGEGPLSNDLVDVDLRTSKEETQQELSDDPPEIPTRLHHPREGSAEDAPKQPQSAEHALTGIGKDLAELKGSVATGFSRFMKVMREEVDHDELSSSLQDDDYVSDSEELDNSATSRQLPDLNSFLRPLLGSILHDEKSTSKDGLEEMDGDSEKSVGLSGDSEKSVGLIAGAQRAISLPRTLGDGLDGISKLASSLFPVSLDSDDEDSSQGKHAHEAVGVTDEVLAFARNISMHPETWLDFPLFTEEEDDDDFEMSDAQEEHVYQVELAAPRLAALRIELCPDYMSEGRFWKIYFVLLHSRLSKTDAILLSTPQIIEARKLLLSKLQKNESQGSKIKEGDTSETAESFKIVSLQAAMEVPPQDFHQVEDLGSNEGRPLGSSLTSDCAEEIQNKTVLANTVKLASLRYDDEDPDADKWLNEEQSPHVGPSAGLAGNVGLVGNDEDVSFSDLEEDDDSFTSKAVESSSSKQSSGWVQLDKGLDVQEMAQSSQKLSLERLKRPEGGESSDWSTVEDDDITSADFE